MILSYQFTVSHQYDFVENAILNAVQLCNSKCKTKPGGEFVFKISQGFGFFPIKFILYISETNGVTTLRFLSKAIDGKRKRWFKTYDKFIIALMPCGVDVPIVTGDPYIVTTVQIGGGLEQEFTSRKGFSATGALAGGLLFGDIGALVGAYSGPSRGRSRTIISNSAFFLICYSNGMIEEKAVQKNTRLYTEVMAKLNAKPVIRKQSITESLKTENKQSENNNSRPTKIFFVICFAILLIFLASLQTQIISNICIAISGILMIITPILFLVWIIRLIARKTARKFGIATLICTSCFIIFFIAAGISLS